MDSLTEANFGNDNNVLLTCNDITGRGFCQNFFEPRSNLFLIKNNTLRNIHGKIHCALWYKYSYFNLGFRIWKRKLFLHSSPVEVFEDQDFSNNVHCTVHLLIKKRRKRARLFFFLLLNLSKNFAKKFFAAKKATLFVISYSTDSVVSLEQQHSSHWTALFKRTHYILFTSLSRVFLLLWSPSNKLGTNNKLRGVQTIDPPLKVEWQDGGWQSS